MKALLNAVLLFTLASGTAHAQVNAGTLQPAADVPFTTTKVAEFNRPWRIAFLPDQATHLGLVSKTLRG